MRCDPRFTLGVTKLQNMGVGSTPPDAHGATATHSPDAFSPFGNFGKRVSLLSIHGESVLSSPSSQNLMKKVPRFLSERQVQLVIK